MNRSLLSGPHISLVSSPFDGEMGDIANRLEHSVRIGGRGDLEDVLCELLACTNPTDEPPSRTLDLIGHSTSDQSLLRLGYWVVDAARAPVRAFFRELADLGVMGRLGIRSVRLLGCQTAATASGRSTICALAEILGIDVFGTRTVVTASHYTPAGFAGDFAHVLVPASELRGTGSPSPLLNGEPFRRTLDIGELPASPLSARPWPLAVATTDEARAIVKMIRRNDGAYMPGLESRPMLEIGIPSIVKPGWYHAIHVVMDGAFVRVFPDAGGPGVVFPVEDPAQLRDAIARLERATFRV